MRRHIANLLFEGLQSLDADRLTTPDRNNAHYYFQRVLALQPDNAIAREGLDGIVRRYVELATADIYRGNFPGAAALLARAEGVLPNHPALAEARGILESERNSGDISFDLDGDLLRQRGEAAVAQLGDIARQAAHFEAIVVITAPSDDLARWIYLTMREAAGGYRLPANIELSNRARIRLRLPDGNER